MHNSQACYNFRDRRTDDLIVEICAQSVELGIMGVLAAALALYGIHAIAVGQFLFNNLNSAFVILGGRSWAIFYQ